MIRLTGFIFVLWVSFSFTQKKSTLLYLTPKQLEDSMKINPKPVMIYYHTDWCKYCIVMENGTFSNSKVIDSIKKNYYMVKFNPESKDSFEFFGRTYKYIEAQKYHEFKYVFDRIQAYPSVTFLNNKLELNETAIGFYKPKSFLKFINAYKKD